MFYLNFTYVGPELTIYYYKDVIVIPVVGLGPTIHVTWTVSFFFLHSGFQVKTIYMGRGLVSQNFLF